MEKQVVKFGNFDSRLGDHSYAGHWTGYYLCDGVDHYKVNFPQGIFRRQCREAGSSRFGPCDKQGCAHGEPVSADELPSAAQEALGILVPVPEGTLLVEQDWAPRLQHTVDLYYVLEAGELVAPKRLEEGRLIAHGETAEVTETRHNTAGAEWTVKLIVRNENGSPVIEDGEKDERRQFARDQIAYLVGLGFSQGRAYKVMKAAGPGQVRRAVEWAYEASQRVPNTDALDMVLCGIGGTNNFGRDRTVAALEALGLPIPPCPTARTLFGVLAGAHVALVAGLPERMPSEPVSA